MFTRQTRIFVLSDEPFDDWFETLLGKVIRALIEEYKSSLNWFWFSRYGSIDEEGDCNIDSIPIEYKQPIQPGRPRFHRSLRFRYCIEDSQMGDFEQRARTLINENNYCISDFRNYDYIKDTGSNRFLGTENRKSGRAEQRAALVTDYFCAIARLVIDALVGPDSEGRFQLEKNDDLVQNPRASTFQSLLHLYCNITNVPTDLYVFSKEDEVGYGTYMYQPDGPVGGWKNLTVHPIRF